MCTLRSSGAARGAKRHLTVSTCTAKDARAISMKLPISGVNAAIKNPGNRIDFDSDSSEKSENDYQIR